MDCWEGMRKGPVGLHSCLEDTDSQSCGEIRTNVNERGISDHPQSCQDGDNHTHSLPLTPCRGERGQLRMGRNGAGTSGVMRDAVARNGLGAPKGAQNGEVFSSGKASSPGD